MKAGQVGSETSQSGDFRSDLELLGRVEDYSAEWRITRPSGGLLGRAEVPRSRDFGEEGSTRPSDGLLGRAVIIPESGNQDYSAE